MQKNTAVLPAVSRPSKNQFFDGVITFCLSPIGLPGGKTHRETALKGDPLRRMNRRSRKNELRTAALNNPKDFFDRLNTAVLPAVSFFRQPFEQALAYRHSL